MTSKFVGEILMVNTHTNDTTKCYRKRFSLNALSL